ncbi:hypothetical protein AMTR_s00065p00165110 [Amborella trichopoda]|uniref:DUF7950 domain-containing protein n=2 Tax=Amborella trichopoda TaxID=13333 RepID=U5D832_AMBTC|nr:hypothetical protein AMTR_s00065p00165110 [Amborella trichopoda]
MGLRPENTAAIVNPLNMFTPSKTEQIMSRYRPIAPKPQFQQSPSPNFDCTAPLSENPLTAALSTTLPASHPKTRPARVRKRRNGAQACGARKKAKTNMWFFNTPLPEPISPFSHQNILLGLPFQGLTRGFPLYTFPATVSQGDLENSSRVSTDLVTLPLLPFPSTSVVSQSIPEEAMNYDQRMPEGKLVMEKLQAPITCKLPTTSSVPFSGVITPQPVRPVGSSISVECISDCNHFSSSLSMSKKSVEVEEELELEALPGVISDANNKVRLANSAYKKMVGQPECSWLESTLSSQRKKPEEPTRINGEVMLILEDSLVPISSNAFTCRVKIEWANKGQRTLVKAPGRVIRLSCDSKDYVFAWRFLTGDAACDSKYVKPRTISV